MFEFNTSWFPSNFGGLDYSNPRDRWTLKCWVEIKQICMSYEGVGQAYAVNLNGFKDNKCIP